MEASLGERVGEVDILVISCGRMAVYSQQYAQQGHCGSVVYRSLRWRTW